MTYWTRRNPLHWLLNLWTQAVMAKDALFHRPLCTFTDSLREIRHNWRHMMFLHECERERRIREFDFLATYRGTDFYNDHEEENRYDR